MSRPADTALAIPRTRDASWGAVRKRIPTSIPAGGASAKSAARRNGSVGNAWVEDLDRLDEEGRRGVVSVLDGEEDCGAKRVARIEEMRTPRERPSKS